MAEELLEEQEVEPESAQERERRETALAKIRKLDDPVLRTRALEVSSFGASWLLSAAPTRQSPPGPRP